MKKRMLMIAAALLCLSLAACGNSGAQTSETTESAPVETGSAQASETEETSSEEQTSSEELTGEMKKVAKDGAEMQTEDSSVSTRIPMEGGTKINMYFGDTLITGVLNDSETARALIAKLPVTQHMNRYTHDFCGVTEELPYNEEDVHYGWLNGDIDYALNAPYFTILFEDEDVSEQYGYQVNIGVVTSPLADIAALDGSFDVRIELAEADTDTAAVQDEPDSSAAVVYFSRVGNTDFPEGIDAVSSASLQTDDGILKGNAQLIAEWIADEAGCEALEIVSEEAYPADYDATVDQAKSEQNEDLRPALKTGLEAVENCETIYLVIPNWWADLPMPVYTFFENHDLSGKTITVFITHEGSRFSRTIDTIRELEPEAEVVEGLAVRGGSVKDEEANIRNRVRENR
ncbi:MAG: hypothetical protein IIY96_07105 [Lachnospiraceae bacterium]|nr:hypothetical protein [Lachnospiraceae bacterium]